MYIDSPKPGFGFISVIIIAIAVMIIIPIAFRRNPANSSAMAVFIIIVCAGGVIVFGMILHAAFNTTYTIDEEKLRVKNGFFLKGEYSISGIERVDRTGFNFQTFGSALHLRGHCNRFTNGLKIVAADRIVYISPADRDRLASFLKERLASRAGGV